MYEPPSGGVQNPAGGERHEGQAVATDTRQVRIRYSWLGLREVPSSEVTYQPVYKDAQYTALVLAGLV